MMNLSIIQTAFILNNDSKNQAFMILLLKISIKNLIYTEGVLLN